MAVACIRVRASERVIRVAIDDILGTNLEQIEGLFQFFLEIEERSNILYSWAILVIQAVKKIDGLKSQWIELWL